MEQKIEPLSDEDAHHVERQRTWVRGYPLEEHARHNYETIEGKLRLLQNILDAGWIEPTEKWMLQSLGICLGDALAQKLGLNWIAVEDDFGRTPSLEVPGSTLILFPLTAISKRIERGEKVDVSELFDGFCEMVAEKRSQGY
ncbi:MAG TPA: DUF3806 domain-containing protein [Rhizomicrobium sp.]|nr:DUF3806 domain-containing protein [Rhizomicrobium sp.]